MSPSLWIWVALVSAGLGGLMAVLQHALRDVSRHSLEQAAARWMQRRRGANGSNGNGHGHGHTIDRDELPASVVSLADDLDGHTAAVALPRVLLNLLSGVAAVLWVGWVRSVGDGPVLMPTWVDAAIGLAAAACTIWVLSVALPLAIARHAAEATVLTWLGVIRACHALMAPPRLVLKFLAEVVRRLAGEDAQTELEQREAELLSLVQESEREGQLDEGAREMIEAVVEFGQTTVEQVMTPRTEMQALPFTDDIAEVKAFVRDGGHSRIPVYGEDLDHIEGVLYVKDLLKWLAARDGTEAAAGESFALRPLLRKPMFVPETKTVRELLKELLDSKVHIAIVIDEYGGTSGLVTIEDIVEEVFGEIQDEYEPEEESLPGVEVDVASGVATVDARTEIDEANDGLGAIGLVLPEHDDYDTVGGYVVTRLGKIPEAGEELREDGMLLVVVEAEPTRVVRVTVRPLEEEAVQDDLSG